MFNEEKIIVSMTSYPKRISNVGKSIYALLSRQTVPPDEIHLWLSIKQFPKQFLDLPKDLQTLIEYQDQIHLHWIEENTYVHKRHEYFKMAKDNECVFLIDDDVYYANNLIENVMKIHSQFPDCIVCYNRYPLHQYKGKKIIYGYCPFTQTPLVNKTRWCGQSMIPAKLYPKECLLEENQIIRNRTSPISDECWFQPWIVYNDIPIYHLNYGWGTDIDKKKGKDTGLCSWTHNKDKNGLEKRDNWLFNVLYAFPQFLDKYRRLFKYGK